MSGTAPAVRSTKQRAAISALLENREEFRSAQELHDELKRRGEQTPQQIVVEADRDLFTYEADMVAAHIADRQAPAMSWDDTLGNMRLLDAWRAEI